MKGLWLLLAGCGFTVTRDVPSYEELSPDEQGLVERILANLSAFDAAVRARGGPGIDALLDREAIQVHFRGIIIATNLGDRVARVSIWDHLDASQQELVASWWGLDRAAAAERYPGFFYDYLAAHIGALEWIYVVQGVERVFDERSRFNVERDAERLTVAYYAEQARAMLDGVAALCAPVRAQYDERWAVHFDDIYFAENVADLVDPIDPTGYVYFFCRWFEDARTRQASLASEMELVKARFGGAP